PASRVEEGVTCRPAPMDLYESDDNDDVAGAERRDRNPRFGARKLHARELNPLTKGCVSELADLNDNGVVDLREHHHATPGPERSWMATFVQMSYFVELYDGYLRPAEEGPGAWVIAERTRCADFPLRYDEGD